MFYTPTYTDLELKASKFDETIKNVGLLDCRRYLHIFHDEKMGNTCKVIQVNISTTRGTNVLFNKWFINKNNGTETNIAVYIYECKLDITRPTLYDKFRTSDLSLLSARSLYRETDHDRGITRSEQCGLHSSKWSAWDLSDYLEARIIVDPKYYCQEHELFINGDVIPYGISEEGYHVFLKGDDLIDANTEVIRHNSDKFATIRDTLLLCDDTDITNRAAGGNLIISSHNYWTSCDSLVNGGIFMYDSLTNSVNFTNNPYILSKKYISQGDVKREIEEFLLSLANVGETLSEEYGNIQILYSPSIIGSKCKILYRDFDENNVATGSIDNGHEITNYIGDIVDDGWGSHDSIIVPKSTKGIINSKDFPKAFSYSL